MAVLAEAVRQRVPPTRGAEAAAHAEQLEGLAWSSAPGGLSRWAPAAEELQGRALSDWGRSLLAAVLEAAGTTSSHGGQGAASEESR